MSKWASCKADVVGSLLRPSYLKEAQAAESMSVQDLKSMEDAAVKQVIAMQESVGLGVVTDGEMRRRTFIGSFDEAVDGIEALEGPTYLWYSPDGPVEMPMGVVITGKLKRRRSVVAEEYAFARACTDLPVKATLVSPLTLFVRWDPTYSGAAYPDPFAMAADAVEIIRADVLELAAQGCRYIQIDAPELATLVQRETREWYEGRGISPDRMLGEGLEMINSLADGVSDVRFGIHLCRGNRKGHWMASGGYDHIAQELFHRTPAFDTVLLEYDDPSRQGTFEPLAQAPEDKHLVLGLLSSKNPELEPAEAIVARIEEAAKYFPKDQLSVSTQCGFASSGVPSASYGRPVTDEDQEAKLRQVVDIAQTVWGG